MCSSGSSRPRTNAGSNTSASATTTACPGGSPVLCQETPMSCGIASTRMVVSSITNNNIPESTLRTQSQDYPGSYTLTNGTRMDNMTELLHANGVPGASAPQSGQTLSSLQAGTACGKPAIIHVSNPGGGGHFMVLDSVRTNPDGTRTAIIRDPWCGGGPSASNQAQGRREMSEADLTNRGFGGWAITNCP